MPFEVGSAVNSLADWVCSCAPVRGVMSNPIFAALLLTAIAVVIILGMYYKEFASRGRKQMIRMALYLLIAMTVFCFLHHYAVTRCIASEAAQKGVRDVFEGIAQSQQIKPTGVMTGGAGDRLQVSLVDRHPASMSGAASAPAAPAPAPQAPRPQAQTPQLRPDNVGPVHADAARIADSLQIEDVRLP